MKKICIITSSYPQKKYQHATARDFAVLLQRKNADVQVLAMDRGGSRIEDDEISVEFISWWGSTDQPLDIYNPKNPIHAIKLMSFFISGIFKTLKIIKKSKSDYCFAMWAIPSGIFALMAKIFLGIPYATWSLGSDIWDIEKIPLGKIILKKILRNADHLYADGIELAKDVEKIGGRNCEFMASNRIFDTSIKKIDYDKFSDDKKNFIFLGRYHHHKGVDIMINAISKLNVEEKEKALFHIFGMPGPEEEKIREMVKELELESMVFVNKAIPADEVFSYLNKSYALIIPSRIESIPVVFCNGIEASKPLIATNVGDMGELIKEYNVGLTVEPNAIDISKSIRTMLNYEEKDLDKFKERRDELKTYLSMQRSVEMLLSNIESRS